MMMKLVVHRLPEITFLVNETVDTPLLSEANVIAKPHEVCRRFPRLVVTGSGFMINTKAAFKTELLWFLRGHHPGDYCLGCNIEPLNSPIKRFLISRKLNKFKLITCRDQFSYRWLRRNTYKPEIYCMPDILFSLPDEWLPAVKAPSKLGISMMHRAGDREDCAYYRTMAQIADEWIRKTGKSVLLMAFDTGKEDDLFACRAVQALMQFPDQTEIVAHTDGTEILTAFAHCEKIIGARFHSVVLALRMGIPVYPLIFREKVRSLLKDIQYPFPVCDLDAIDNASLFEYIGSDQTSYPLEQDIHMCAGEHVQLLKQRLAT
jgi:polysaccharide pyruvyl transferase WcaK-like protein